MNNRDIETILSKKGIRPTANRILVVRALSESTNPLSLTDLETVLYPMDKGSIFRVLELLAENELVHVIEDGSRSQKYEMCDNDDHHTISDQHVHFYCESCKTTYCLEEIKVPVIEIPDGFMPRSVNFVLKGKCPKCK